jgi:hypothetical protein
MVTRICLSLLVLILGIPGASAQEAKAPAAPAPLPAATCPAGDKPCMMKEVETLAAAIENKSWRDQTYRELAKSYTYEGLENLAIPLIAKIETPDTKAMTIRGIGFAAADDKWTDKARYDALWDKLAIEAKKIDHPPSQGIAWTYIAMAQAFAKDDAAATKTALAMENEALRHKALGESAEIQADRGDFPAAMASIGHIGSAAFRNKAYRTVANIFTGKGLTQDAYNTAAKIDNPYTRAQALQAIVNHGNPEEVKVESEE